MPGSRSNHVVRKGQRVRVGDDGRSKLRRTLSRLVLRGHVALIVLATYITGAIINHELLRFGFTQPVVRWPLGVALSFAAFVLFVRIWLWFIAGQAEVEDGVVDVSEQGTDPVLLPDERDDEAPEAPTAMRGESDEHPGWLALQAADVMLWPELLYVGLFVAAIGGVFIGGALLIWGGPAMLVDAAFEIALGSGLIRATRQGDRVGWFVAVLRASIVPLVATLAASLVFGATLEERCPAARTISDVTMQCLFLD